MTMAKKTDEQPETVTVVMTANTYDAALGDKVDVSPEQAERLIREGHARIK